MEHREARFIHLIDRALNSEKLTIEQRKVLIRFDRFNELEAGCALSTRLNYLVALHDIGVGVGKPFQEMTKEDLQTYFHEESKHHKEGTIKTRKARTKRFFTWMEWMRVNKDKLDEEKLDIKDTKPPYCVRWIKHKRVGNALEFEDLPSEAEIVKIASCVEGRYWQKNRALLLTLWETGASPIEILNLRIKDVAFNQYGGIVRFAPYTRKKTKQINKLKTPYRYREVPIATSVPDLMAWISMHPDKDKPEAPLWTSQKGGQLSYGEMYRKFKRAVKKAGIKKKLTPYSFRHQRLSALSDTLSMQELKRFAEHSKFSNITARYIHTDGKAIQNKVYAERGVQVEDEKPKSSPLKVKVCPRCKHKNSPTFKFCAMCSMPLTTETMFEVQKRGELLAEGHFRPMSDNKEYRRLEDAFYELQEKRPTLYDELTLDFYRKVAIELLKEEQTVKAKA